MESFQKLHITAKLLFASLNGVIALLLFSLLSHALGFDTSTAHAMGPPTFTCGYLDFTCMWRSLLAGIGWFLIWASGLLLIVMAMLFDSALELTITKFGSDFYPLIQTALENIWTVFRDVANIMIIGVFVFVATSIILGSNSFGQKQFIVKVLIIALLLNFSLFFTKLTIDVSHITAQQFYNAIPGNNTATGSSAPGGSILDPTLPNRGVAPVFFNFIGITSFADTYDLLRKATEKNESGWIAVLYGMFTATLFIVVALVLGYGFFILASRAIMLIFLMMTSSLAFVAFATPKLNTWWDRWLEELIKNSLFAPLFLMLLWAVAGLASGLAQARGGGGALGQVISNPTTEGNISMLLSFAIITGLLYAAMKIASSLSTQGSRIALTGFGSKFLLPGAILGALGRHTIGRSNSIAALETDRRLKKAEADPNATEAEISRLRRRHARQSALAKSTFNYADTFAGKEFAKFVGAKGLLSGTTGKGGQGGYQGIADRQGKALADEAKARTVSKEDQDAVAKEAFAEIKDTIQKTERRSLKQDRELADRELETEKRQGQALIQAHKEDMSRKRAEANAPGLAENQRQIKQQAVQYAEQEHQREMNEQKSRIETANEKVEALKKHEKELDKRAERGGSDFEKYLAANPGTKRVLRTQDEVADDLVLEGQDNLLLKRRPFVNARAAIKKIGSNKSYSELFEEELSKIPVRAAARGAAKKASSKNEQLKKLLSDDVKSVAKEAANENKPSGGSAAA